MDFPIKSEPDLFEDTLSQSAEFLDEKPGERNEHIISETNTNSKIVHKIRKTPKNSVVKKKEKLTSHWRKRFLKAFQQECCIGKTIEKYASANNLNVRNIIEFYENAAKEAQQFVYEECDSLSFNNIEEWLKYFKAINIEKQCNYEAAIILNAITNNEYHPQPESIGGINLRAIYKFLSNALMGLPQQQLDEASAKFLSNEFQNLINEANTDEADSDVRNMKSKIEGSINRTTNGNSFKLDPLNTNNEDLERCYSTLFKYYIIKK